MATDRGVGKEIVKQVIWKVDIDAGFILRGHGADEHALAEEELEINGECLGIRGVQVPERVDQGGTVYGLLVHGGVEVVEKAIPGVDGDSCCFGDGFPAVKLVIDDINAGVVAVKGVECLVRNHQPNPSRSS